MRGQIDKVVLLLQTPVGRLELGALLVMGLCILAILFSVAFDFAMYGQQRGVKTRKRSVIATGGMTLFFLVFSLLLRFRIWETHIENLVWRVPFLLVGLGVIVTGCAVNIAGRLDLGKNWANQVTLYKDQSLVTDGVYRLVRHPLYASLIWMFYGASLVYLNAAALLANTLVFLPFMYLRAKQEEKLLKRELTGYAEYAQRVGMFFPRIGRG